MSDGATLSALGATYRAAISDIEGAQSSANVTIDRCNAAVTLIGTAADGSSNELVTNALTGVAGATLALEQAIVQLVQSKTDLEQYLTEREI